MSPQDREHEWLPEYRDVAILLGASTTSQLAFRQRAWLQETQRLVQREAAHIERLG